MMYVSTILHAYGNKAYTNDYMAHAAKRNIKPMHYVTSALASGIKPYAFTVSQSKFKHTRVACVSKGHNCIKHGRLGKENADASIAQSADNSINSTTHSALLRNMLLKKQELNQKSTMFNLKKTTWLAKRFRKGTCSNRKIIQTQEDVTSRPRSVLNTPARAKKQVLFVFRANLFKENDR